MTKFPDKDPTDVAIYELAWAGVLNGDTIASVDDIVITPVTSPALIEPEVGSPPAPERSFTDDTVTFWLSGGEAGTKYTVSMTVTTAAGQTLERSASVKVKQL